VTQRCKSPFICCDTGLDAEVGCFCKVDIADSSRAQGGNDVHTTKDPNHGRSCFNDRTGIWLCIKGFCAPEKYCLDEGKMCQYTDMGPACEPNERAQHILASGCTDACQCGCRGRDAARFCPCLEQLAERSIESSAENIIKPVTETVASILTKGKYFYILDTRLWLTETLDDTLSPSRSCRFEGAKHCGSDWIALICNNEQWVTWKTCQKRQKCTQKPHQDPVCSLRKLPLADTQSDEPDTSASIYTPDHFPPLPRQDETSIHDHVSKDGSMKMDLNHEW
jgi:hypothetical protein